MTRQDKIKLLYSIRSGRVSIEHIRPKDLLIKIGNEGTQYFCNDKQVTQEKFNELMKLEPKPVTFDVYIGDKKIPDD